MFSRAEPVDRDRSCAPRPRTDLGPSSPTSGSPLMHKFILNYLPELIGVTSTYCGVRGRLEFVCMSLTAYDLHQYVYLKK